MKKSKNNQIIVDAINIRNGGGLKHISKILEKSNQYDCELIVFTTKTVLSSLPKDSSITYKTARILEKTSVGRFLYSMVYVPIYCHIICPKILFIPGAITSGLYRNYCLIHQNSLPFTKSEFLKFDRISRIKLEIKRILQIYSFRRAKKIICLTNNGKSEIKDFCNNSQDIVVIPHGIESNISNRKNNEISAKFELLYVSHHSPYKNHLQLLMGYERLLETTNLIHLTLVGAYNEHQSHIKRIRKTESLSKNISIIDQSSTEYINKLYDDCDGVIYTSSCENQPFIILEAASKKKPIIALKIPPVVEILQNYAFYFDTLNEQEIMIKLKNFIENKNLRQYNAEKAFEIVSQNFTWNQCISKTYNFLLS